MSDGPTNQSIEFPFRLVSEIPEMHFGTDIVARKMDAQTKERLLHIENVEYTSDGRLSTFTTLPGCLISLQLTTESSVQLTPEIDTYDAFCASNYVLTSPTAERAREFNFALRLTGDSCSSLYIGYGPNGTTHFLAKPNYRGFHALYVGQTEISSIADLLKCIERGRVDTKLQLMSEIYLHAHSDGLRNETRYLELVIILEMLLLPRISTELSYRFSLRLAKLVKHLFDKEAEDVFKQGRAIYKTRSNLVHTGTDKTLPDVASLADGFSRMLLSSYIRDPSIFDEAKLDELCLS